MPLRVVMDQRLARYRTGGITRYALELADALDRLPDIELRRIRHQADDASVPDSIRLRTPAHHRFETYAVGVELALQRVWFDVYHAPDFIAPRFARAPVVVTVHDLAFLRRPDQLSDDALRYYRQVRNQAQRTAHWITPSDWTRRELMDLAGVAASDITAIPHGVSTFVGTGGVVPREQRRPYILAVGTVEPRKRYDLLLDAFARLSARPELHIVGAPGWNTEPLQRRLRDNPGVVWHDNAPDEQVNSLVSNALALAVPSLAEGFGLGALEAMARGTPVISSGLGALSEVTGPAAHVPNHDDPASWAEAIEQVIEDERHWNELSRLGVQRAAEFSWELSARRTAAIYRQVAG